MLVRGFALVQSRRVKLAQLVPLLALTAVLVSVAVAFVSPTSWPFTLPPLAFLTLWSVRLAQREA